MSFLQSEKDTIKIGQTSYFLLLCILPQLEPGLHQGHSIRAVWSLCWLWSSPNAHFLFLLFPSPVSLPVITGKAGTVPCPTSPLYFSSLLYLTSGPWSSICIFFPSLYPLFLPPPLPPFPPSFVQTQVWSLLWWYQTQDLRMVSTSLSYTPSSHYHYWIFTPASVGPICSASHASHAVSLLLLVF